MTEPKKTKEKILSPKDIIDALQEGSVISSQSFCLAYEGEVKGRKVFIPILEEQLKNTPEQLFKEIKTNPKRGKSRYVVVEQVTATLDFIDTTVSEKGFIAQRLCRVKKGLFGCERYQYDPQGEYVFFLIAKTSPSSINPQVGRINDIIIHPKPMTKVVTFEW